MMATVKNPHPRLVIYGVGQFGLHVIRMAVSKNWPIVAAFNRAGSKVGQDIGRLAGLDRDLGVVVQDCDTADFNSVKADIGVVAMTDRLALNMPAYKRLINAGMNVVCHGSEAYYPTGIDKALAAEIDELARHNNVSFTGTGIWDYSRIWAGIVVAGPCTDITRVFHRSITNAQGYGERLMMLTGVGMTPAEYDEKVGKVQGMLGGFYKTIPHQVMEALGYHAISVTETREPVLFDKPIHCSLLGKDIAPGLAAGTRIVIRVETEEGIPAEAHIELRLFWPEESEHMMWHIEGKPSSKITVERDDSGYATAACLFNRIPDVIAAEPGLRVLSQLGPMKHTALLP
jgi:4-hydroxy-tetrahydrodipicolinate reductase